jgi:hypothetical protein
VSDQDGIEESESLAASRDTPRPETETRSREEDDDAFPGIDELIGTFLEEASLWPVLLVGLGSGGAFGAALLILTAVDRNPFAAVALLLVLGMTVDLVWRAYREPDRRNIALLLGLLWASSIAFAGLALWTGLASR